MKTLKNLKNLETLKLFPTNLSLLWLTLPSCLSDAVEDTTYGTAGRRHGQLLMMVKDGEWTQLSAADFTF